MKTNKILVTGLAASVTFFFLGWLIFGMLMKDYYATHTNNCAMKPMEAMIWPAMILSNLAWGFLFAMLMYWSNSNTWMAGAKVGAIAGFLMFLTFDARFYSMSTMFNTYVVMFMDVIVSTVMCAIAGAVAGAVAGMGTKNEVQ